MDVCLKKDKDLYPYSNWAEGSFEYRNRRYVFQAKIYPEPSVFGINEGNVSKLWVSTVDSNSKENKLILLYDRGHSYGDERMYSRGMIKNLVEYLGKYAEANPLQD